jgi:dihydrofolate synthase/folylpolyglutamate synthase
LFKNAKDAIEYIESCRRRKYNLSSVESLFAKYDNFHLKIKTVHVGGTNGKGSTTNFINNVLIESGYKVGLFTSPYLICHNDRIRINNTYISDDDILEIINKYYDDFQLLNLSFFEIDTFIALYYFYINKVDIAVIEVGLGGRLDATNVIRPLISVVVNIGMDHMEYLGNTLESIAFEKAGIIKDNTPFYTMETKEECINVFKKTCELHNAEYNQIKPPVNVKFNEESTTFELDGETYQLQGSATYQPLNATLAINVCKRLKNLGFDKINLDTIKSGIYKSFWLGRFEKISSTPLVYIDGGHNAPAIKVLCETLNMYKSKGYKIKIIFSALKDKEYTVMLHELMEVSDDITVTQFDAVTYRFSDAKTLLGDLPLKINENWHKLYHEVMNITDEKALTVFLGSIYFIAKVRAYHYQQRGEQNV